MGWSDSTRRVLLRSGVPVVMAGIAGCSFGGSDIKDTDGDGVIDSEDYAPRDSEVQERSDLQTTEPETATDTETETDTATDTETETDTATDDDDIITDGFESGAYDDGDPVTWQVESAGDHITVQSNTVKNGEHALEAKSAGGDNKAILDHHAGGHTVEDGDVYSAWLRSGGQVPRAFYNIHSPSKTAQVSCVIVSDHNNLVIRTTEDGSVLDEVKAGPGNVQTWYLFEVELHPSNTELVGRIYDSSKSLIEEATLAASAETALEHTEVLAPTPFGSPSKAWFDDVTVGG